jgi:MYXO-CTERM domain-containing protein
MNSRSLCTAAVVVALVASFSADRASAYCRMTTPGNSQIGDEPCPTEGTPLYWKDACLSYAIDYRGSQWMDYPDIETAVDASFAAWQGADCGGTTPNLIFKALEPSECQRPEFNTTGNVNTIAFLDPWKDPCADADDPGYSPFAFAVTIVWNNTSTGEILDADMMINDELATSRFAGGPYANCPPLGCPSGNPGEADLANIVTHEAGHFIGIGHSDVAEATMYAMADRTSTKKRSLEQDDINAVCDIYPPGNLDDTCNAAPTGGLELNCETDANGDPIACDDPAAPPSSGGCSATRTPADAPWAALLAALLGLTVLRRRSGRRDARS